MYKTITLVLALSAVPVLAQTPGTLFIENWDLDGKGSVNVDELTERRGLVFGTFDDDENDSLDADEYARFDEARKADMEANAGGHGNGQGGGRMMESMTLALNDTDGDGSVSRDEFVAGSTGWFAMIDRNEDGSVTSDDFGPRSN